MTKKSPIPGTNTLLIGASGTGKTTSLRTLIEAGIKPFIIFTEPGMEVLGGLDEGSYEWVYIPPATVGFDVLSQRSQTILNSSYESITKMTDANKRKYSQFLDVLAACNNFTNHKGEEFGDVSGWGTDRAIVIDSLSGLSVMAQHLTVGGKPTLAPGEWNIGMNCIESVIMTLTNGTHCHFVLIAHAEKEHDEVSGAISLMASTLGKKLAPKLPRNFSDVIQAVRTDKGWTWTTDAYGADLKARNVPWAANLPPSFVPLIEQWKKNGGVIEDTEELHEQEK